ncbi:MAG: hypothetical protein JJU15_01475 [Pararhodobacter sp.]|nr:hypothetical protein [Pararhodobacter sp.]
MPRFMMFAVIAALSGTVPVSAMAESARTGFDWGERATDTQRLGNGLQPVTHQFDMRFGIVYSSDRGMEPGMGARYRVTFNHQFDNGWQLGVSMGVSVDNLNSPAPWRYGVNARH